MATLTASLLQTNPDYIYPLALNLIAGMVPVWASMRVGAARRATQLEYPAEFHEDGFDEKTNREHYLFNCAQRAHKVRTLDTHLNYTLSTFQLCFVFMYLRMTCRT